MSLMDLTTSTSRRSSLSSSIEVVKMYRAGREEENADDDRVDQLLSDAASGRETQLAQERQTVATLTAVRDALAEESRDRETQLEEERQKVATLTAERDAIATESRDRETQLAKERQKVAKISAERDALAAESRDRETKIVELNNEMEKLHKQLEGMELTKQTKQPLELDEMEMKNNGQILFRIPNFKAFAEGRGPAEGVFSEPVEYLFGMPWRVVIEHNLDWIDLSLKCDCDTNDMAWQCKASYKFSVISRTKGEGCLKGGFEEDDIDLFYAADNCWGWTKFAKIEKLMDPKNGFYDVEEDTLTFKAEVIVTELKGMPGVRTEHTLLVNGKVVHVNKHLLAAHSMFFQNLFFGANAEAVPKVLIENDEDETVAHFERMISTMTPLNLELDDESVAGVLLLANHFQLGSVVNRCVNFLLTKSKKSAIVKFRLADQCDIVGMKEKLLADMTKDDFAFAGENFMDNLSVIKKLGLGAVHKLTKRHRELFGTE